ncbi:hypothetical protein [Anaerosoma tenue]|uniref:hypothetical protein n=1 Tax=Anaerosoma tenue TaxID=2933588 RepID=UPI002260F4F3|nr:hypothetical protein [Anaerosoma tenue]MCK8115472.1 hypothetical protein [Anaerosoma tenue]
MKKTAFVLFLAAILVFAFAASAMANTSSGTITWDPTAPNDSPATPHKGYAYNTEKCLVCHAVHKASATGEVLLGATVGNACDYCHVSSTGASSVRVYNNDPTNHQSDTEFNHSNSCTACHAVHGANTVDQTDLSQKILKADIGVQSGVPAVDWDLSTGSRDGALSAYCTQCHPYYVSTYALSNTDGDIAGTGEPGPYNSHIMTADFVAYEPGAHISASVDGDQVAYASSAYCTSCHDGGADTVADNFPHLTSGARFMMSSDFVNDTATAAAKATEDGVCLKCHVGTDGLTGVGIGF